MFVYREPFAPSYARIAIDSFVESRKCSPIAPCNSRTKTFDRSVPADRNNSIAQKHSCTAFDTRDRTFLYKLL